MRSVRLASLQPRVTGLLQAAAFVTVVFSIATLADHLHRYLELFSHFRLQYLVAAVLLAVLLFALRSRRWAALMLAIAVVNVVPIWPWYVAADRTAQQGETTIRLLLANLNSGNRNMQPLIDVVTAEEADLVFLQELTSKHSAELIKLRDTFAYSLIIPREDNFGIAALSRYPFRSARVIESPPFDLPSLVVEVEFGDKVVAFVTTHPLPPIGKTGFESRNAQLDSVIELINRFEGPRVLIGDLNTTMWGHHYGLLVEETGLVNSRFGFGILPTWPTHLPFAKIPIDHCLVSEKLRVTDTRTGPDIGSDHLPLIVELTL